MSGSKAKSDGTKQGDRESAPALDHIASALRDLQFGVVSVIVQDGVVIQIERTEKKRLRGKQQT